MPAAQSAVLPTVRAQADVRDLYMWRPIAIDVDVLGAAWAIEERYGLSYWGALIVAAAQIAGCDRLLTEDLSHGQSLGGVIVMNPFAHTPDSLL